MKKQPPIFGRKRAGGAGILLWTVLSAAILLVPPAIPHLTASRIPRPASRAADAVFVLSGGEGRIQEGYREWTERGAGELYILGAGVGVELTRILPEASALPASSRSRIHVEMWSENTLENAFSAKSVVGSRGFTSVVVVTSDYHVPRAYLAFRKVLSPGLDLTVLPVRSERWERPGAAWRWGRRRFLEGWKYWGYRVLLRWE
ncbi:MAG: YdcF family protein [Deltaproteobacteria bacterium]|nr:YdcF family protein [Deltaproteobacteria bacterium]